MYPVSGLFKGDKGPIIKRFEHLLQQNEQLRKMATVTATSSK